MTRKELYDLVWSKPLSTLAKEYDISDNGLRKICKKYEISLPKNGHWQRAKFGKGDIQEPYVHEEKWENITIKLSENEDGESNHKLARLARLSKEIEKAYPDLIVVKDRLTNPDKLIQDAQADLNSKKLDRWYRSGNCLTTSQGILSVSVTNENIPRALRFMDAFIKLLRKRGHDVGFKYENAAVFIDDQSYQIRCREKHTRQINNDRGYQSSDLIPNGILSLKLDELYHQEWKDGKTPLEKQLAKIVAALEIKAADDKIEEAKRKAYREEYDRKEAIRKEEKANHAWEKEKGSILIEDAKKWNQTQRLKSFIDEIENQSKDLEFNAEVNAWIKWAKEQAIKQDPLSKGLLEMMAKYEKPKIDLTRSGFFNLED